MPAADPLRIVLLEDDADTRGALAALFRFDGHVVHEAYDAPSFAAATSSGAVDAIVFDLSLGGAGSGTALVSDYRADCQRQHRTPPRLIALSGSRPDLEHLAIPCPVHHRFQKPVDYTVLAKALSP